MLTAFLFMGFNFTGYFLALARSPFWGLLVYINIYFNTPIKSINWWATYLPDIRWSLVSSLVLIISIFIHKDKISNIKISSLYLVFALVIITYITTKIGVTPSDNAAKWAFKLLSYSITMVLIVKIMANENQYRIFILAVIFFGANLSLKAYLYGERINGRLEGIGATDALHSNPFALLLIGIMPLMIPFLIRGKLYEKVICWLSLPLLLNAFILCNSRGGFVALVLSVITVFIFVADKQIRKSILLVSLCFIPVFLYLADEQLINRISTLVSIQSNIDDEAKMRNVSSGRTEIWGYGLEIAKNYPFGAGPNGFKNLARFYMPEELLTFQPGRGYGMRGAHNTYLQLLVEQGIIGLLIFLAICAQVMRLIYRGLKYSKDNLFWKYNFMALGVSFMGSMFGGMFTARIYYEFFWWQVAIVMVAYSLAIKSGQNDVKQVIKQ